MTRPHLDPEIMQFDTHFERVGKILADELATEFDECDAREIDRVVEALFTVPIDMVIYCPACGMQHIDKDNTEEMSIQAAELGIDREGDRAYSDWLETNEWTNPPHCSHECQHCNYTWRPADVPTNGVAAVKTKGKNDSPDLREFLRNFASNRGFGVTKASIPAPRPSAEEVARIETHRKALRHFDILRDLRNRVMEISFFRFRKTDVLAEIDAARDEIRRVDEGETR